MLIIEISNVFQIYQIRIDRLGLPQSSEGSFILLNERCSEVKFLLNYDSHNFSNSGSFLGPERG